MNKPLIAILMAGSVSLGACNTYENQRQLETAGTGAAIGAVAGAGVGALAGGVIEGALIGAAVGGLAGAVWADQNNDGYTDGYMYEGRYYEGEPPDYVRYRQQPQPYDEPPPPPVRRAGERG